MISGGAKGVDAAAMNGAVEAGGAVIGVLADSLERRARSVALRNLVQDERVVLLSPNGSDVPFSVGLAMGRNRLIYCLADLAVVVSASEGEGGTWAGATEALKAEARLVRKVGRAAWQMDLLAVELLQAHDEHRAVRFQEHGRPDPDEVVGLDGKEEAIECGVMQLAEHDAVADERLTLGLAVGRDVGRVQELLMTQPAERAAPRAWGEGEPTQDHPSAVSDPPFQV